jgi:hypothetical protein
MPGRLHDSATPQGWRFALVALPLAELVFDGVENGCIATMLLGWPDLSPGLVRISSLAT